MARVIHNKQRQLCDSVSSKFLFLENLPKCRLLTFNLTLSDLKQFKFTLTILGI